MERTHGGRRRKRTTGVDQERDCGGGDVVTGVRLQGSREECAVERLLSMDVERASECEWRCSVRFVCHTAVSSTASPICVPAAQTAPLCVTSEC